MNHKVLLADDSLTIQKVIKITLANQPFEIVDCVSDDELFKKLPDVKPELVFLDFNLSEKYTGYELTAKIKAAVPSAQVLLLLGTFDTIDEAAMEKCGAVDKIVKPFDSNKFIAICKRLVDTAPIVEEIKFPEPKAEQEFIVSDSDDQWTMNHTVEMKAESKITPEHPKIFDVRNHLNPLDQVVSDWGMSIPGIINDDSSHDKIIDLPPVIGDVKPLIDHKMNKSLGSISHSLDIKFPVTDDLDYPTIEQMEERKSASPYEVKQKSKLISIETLNQPAELEIEHTINSMEETDVSSIEAQIRDEVEEDLWKVDEFEDLKKEVSAKIEEVRNNLQPSEKEFDESLFKPIDDQESIKWNPSPLDISFDQNSIEFSKPASSAISVSTDQLMQQLMPEIENLIKKHVKEYIDQMLAQKSEKIIWEIVPDLAENLIRQEISKISNKILNDSN